MKTKKTLADESRVWIYQSIQPISEAQQKGIQSDIDQFCQRWNSHGKAVKGEGGVAENHFIYLIADTSAAEVSGCSIDSSVALIKEIEKRYDLHLFDRMHIPVLIDSDLMFLHLNALRDKLESGEWTGQELCYDINIRNLKQLKHEWPRPLSESWLARYIPSTEVKL